MTTPADREPAEVPPSRGDLTPHRRVVVIVLDSVGIGAMPDAEAFGDGGTNTLGHTAAAVGGLDLPNLARLGLGNIAALEGVRPVDAPAAFIGRMAERSAGKDTTTGHWELMGLPSPSRSRCSRMDSPMRSSTPSSARPA